MPVAFVKFDFLFLFYIFCFFVKNQVFIGVWINIWVFNSVPLVLLSVFMPIPGYFQYCSSVVEFEVRDCDVLEVPLLYRIVLALLGFLFAFQYEVEYCSFEVCEEFCWDVDGYCTESVDCFW